MTDGCEVGITGICGHLMWVLGTNLRCSDRVGSALGHCALPWPSLLYMHFLIFVRGICILALAGLELLVPLLQPPEGWDSMPVPRCLLSESFCRLFEASIAVLMPMRTVLPMPAASATIRCSSVFPVTASGLHAVVRLAAVQPAVCFPAYRTFWFRFASLDDLGKIDLSSQSSLAEVCNYCLFLFCLL